jgi:hypothetical protein
MTKLRAVLVTTLAMSALGAVLASTASAAWFISGTELKEGQTAALATTAKVEKNIVFTVPSVTLKVTCTGLSATKPEIVQGTDEELHATSLEFTGCGVTEPTNCKTESTTIATEAVDVLTGGVTESPDTKTTLKPHTGTTIAVLTLTGGACALAGEKALSGDITLNSPTLLEEKTEQALEGLGTLENESLQLGGKPAYLEGKALLKLSSGKQVRDVHAFQYTYNASTLHFFSEIPLEQGSTLTNHGNDKIETNAESTTAETIFKAKKNCLKKALNLNEACVMKIKLEMTGNNSATFNATVEDVRNHETGAAHVPLMNP